MSRSLRLLSALSLTVALLAAGLTSVSPAVSETPALVAGTGGSTTYAAGTVSDAAGRPLEGIVVGFEIQRSRSWLQVSKTTTDSHGRYSLLAGNFDVDYRLGFRDPSGNHAYEFYDEVSTRFEAVPFDETGPSGEPIDVALAPASRFSGRVLLPDGRPADADVVVYAEGTEQPEIREMVTTVRTDDSGFYEVAGLRAGRYRVGFVPRETFLGRDLQQQFYDRAVALATSTPVTVAPNTPRDGVDAVLTLRGHLTGQVTGPGGAPVPSISVVLHQLDPVYHFFWEKVTTTTTDGDGRYDFANLQPGMYRLSYDDGDGPLAAGVHPDVADIVNGDDVTLPVGRDVEVDLEMFAASSITGVVTDAAGNPVDYPSLRLQRVTSSETEFAQRYGGPGGYGFFDLPAGSYRLDAAEAGERTRVVELGRGEDVVLDIQFDPRGELSGTVTNDLSQSDVRATAYLRRDGGWDSVAEVPVDGAYSFDLVAGQYRVIVSDRYGGLAPRYYTGTATGGTPATLVVSPGALTRARPITMVPLQVVNRIPPTIEVGAFGSYAFSSLVGSWAPAAAQLTRQWLRDGRPIPGATGSRYLAVPEDHFRKISLRVTGRLPGLPRFAITTESVLAILAHLERESSGRAGGRPRAGRVVRARPGTSVPAATSVGYQWQISGVDIPGANSRTFRVPRRLRGYGLSVRIELRRGGHMPLAETIHLGTVT